MPDNILRVAVTGDTGNDIYTEYVRGYTSVDGRVKKPEAAYDLPVPSGAAFTALAIQELLAPKGSKARLKVQHLLPKEARDAINNGDSFTTLLKFLVELKRFDTLSDSRRSARCVVRVARTRPILNKDPVSDEGVFRNLVSADKGEVEANNIDLLVIHDGAGSWRKYPPDGNGGHLRGEVEAINLVKDVLDRSPSPDGQRARPRIIVDLSHDLPAVTRDDAGTATFPSKLTFWNMLSEHEEEVCVICSATNLRHEGSGISRRLSWEQTIEDLAAELLLFDSLKVLTRFKHLIIRFGVVAALHITKENNKRVADLIFAPCAKGGIHRDPTEDGFMVGSNALLAVALTQMIAATRSHAVGRQAFTKAIKNGLVACMRSFDAGYSVLDWPNLAENKRLTPQAGEKLIKDLFASVRHVFLPSTSDPVLAPIIMGDAQIPPELLSQPWDSSHTAKRWEILHDSIKSFGGPVNRTDDSTVTPRVPPEDDVSRINVGIAIALFGRDMVLNREWDNDTASARVKAVLCRAPCPFTVDQIREYISLPASQKLVLHSIPDHAATQYTPRLRPIYAPIMTFGKLTVVERVEIESLRSIRNLFRTYLETCSRAGSAVPPISVAVFGPPGSGKSFAIRQLTDDINAGLQDSQKGLEPIEYNVSQFKSVDDLGEAITRASVVNNEGKIPLVFFDEFDCVWDGGPLGWLKYFLAPMQDGTFYGTKQTIKIARAIFVFAGGIATSFKSFDPSLCASTAQSAASLAALQREFEAKKGPDFTSRLRGHIDILPINRLDRAKGVKPIVRRAIVLRAILESRKLVEPLYGMDIAAIDEDVLYALLTVEAYRHGTRSIEAILQTCSPIDGRIEKASLPSRAQLNMYADADEFFLKMYQGRLRPASLAMTQDEIRRNASGSTEAGGAVKEIVAPQAASRDLGGVRPVGVKPAGGDASDGKRDRDRKGGGPRREPKKDVAAELKQTATAAKGKPPIRRRQEAKK